MKQYDYKTISRTMLGDLHTPVSTYLKVRDIFPQSALMESSDYHGSENNRSFIALCPLASVSIDHGTAIFRLPDDSREEHPITDAYRVENALNDFRARFRVEGEYSNYSFIHFVSMDVGHPIARIKSKVIRTFFFHFASIVCWQAIGHKGAYNLVKTRLFFCCNLMQYGNCLIVPN